jgi:hypothetical protein
MPGMKASSTVEWHSAHWTPTALRVLPSRLKKPVTPDDRIRFEEQGGIGWIVEVHLAGLDGRGDVLRHGLHVDFESELERLLRAQPRSDAAELLARKSSMELELPAPEFLAAECVEAEDFFAVR